MSSYRSSRSVGYAEDSATDSRSMMSHSHATRKRPRTTATSNENTDNDIVCAITESRGISPSIGLSFVNLSTSEAVLCQFTDTQTYARTCHKINVFFPTEILYMSTAADSKLISIIRENLDVDQNGIIMTSIDRKYWTESAGFDFIHQLAFPEDLESLKISLSGNYYATCCFSATIKYIDMSLGMTFAPQTLRVRFESSEGSMMIDLSTMSSLELIRNLQQAKSKDCLFGLLNQTLTRMGGRMLRNNILQPSTDREKLENRYEAVTELSSKQELFQAVRSGLQDLLDTDKVLAAVLMYSPSHMEQSMNNVLALKSFIFAIRPIWQGLVGATSKELQTIRELCTPVHYVEVENLLRLALNPDAMHSTKPRELRSQRVYAINAGINTFLDIARQTFKEVTQDIVELVSNLGEQHDIALDLCYDPQRQYYIKVPIAEFEEKQVPDVFVNRVRKKKVLECQTLELVKRNQRIKDAHDEAITLSNFTIQKLVSELRPRLHALFRISEAIAMLDMLAGFAQLVTAQDYVRPDLTETFAIKSGRHPIREISQREKYIPNDVYAAQQKRFQIITGCNMSGKSTYIRSIALMVVIAQVGCFVPAQYASFPLTHQLFARVSTDDNIEANVSTFASEMREIAFILRNIEPQSLIIIDELGRGTSTTDGLAIAIAIAEALIESKAFVWFITHFRDLPRILSERAGVVNLHLTVDIAPDLSNMVMRYKISDGFEEQKYYGLALARLVAFPENVLRIAAKVSRTLNERNEARRSNPKVLAVARRRKLVLGLREQLVQAQDSNMPQEDLRLWLRRLQDEFIVRMSAIDAEAECHDDQARTSNHITRASSADYETSSIALEDDRQPGTSPQADSALTASEWPISRSITSSPRPAAMNERLCHLGDSRDDAIMIESDDQHSVQ